MKEGLEKDIIGVVEESLNLVVSCLKDPDFRTTIETYISRCLGAYIRLVPKIQEVLDAYGIETVRQHLEEHRFSDEIKLKALELKISLKSLVKNLEDIQVFKG